MILPKCGECGKTMVPVIVIGSGTRMYVFMCECINPVFSVPLQSARRSGKALEIETGDEDTCPEECGTCLFKAVCKAHADPRLN